MRAWKMISVVALVMAVSGTAWAVTVPGLPATSFDYLKSRNEDMGSTYVVAGLAAGDQFTYDPSTLVSGVPTPVVGNLNGTPGVTRTVTKFGATGALVLPSGRTEDSWGIALLYQISGGHLNNPGAPGSIVGFQNPPGIVYDNSAGAQSTWLTIMFHSGVDTQVVTTAGNGINGIPAGQQKQTATTAGLMFELYAVDAAGIDATLVGPPKDSVNLADYVGASRTGLSTYKGWTGNTIAGSVLLATGTNNYFQSSVVVDAAGVIVSNAQDAATAYFDINPLGPGLWNPIWGAQKTLLNPLGGPANMWFQWTLDNGQRSWEVHSDDVGGVSSLVPEPLTVLGLILGVGSVGGYIRRRFRNA